MLLIVSYAILWTLIGFYGGILVLTIRKLTIVRHMISDLEDAAEELYVANKNAFAEMAYGHGRYGPDDDQYPNFFGQLEHARDHLWEQSPDRGT